MSAVPVTDSERASVQRRSVAVLAVGQVLGGVAFGATVSLGALLAAELSGDDALSGFATATTTLGAALCAIPLSRFASRWGRRRALNLGNLFALLGIVLIVSAAVIRSFPLLLCGVACVGAGNAGNLQSRFAAVDLAAPQQRGRDLSIVVWSTAIGGVAGPLLLGPGEAVGLAVGMPPHTGSYLFSFVAQCAAFLLYLVALRPDPLLLAQRIAREASATGAGAVVDRPLLARFAMLASAGSHVVMASVMAMTPIHVAHQVMDAHQGHDSSEQVAALVGITIALHVGGMYGLSPLFGMLADRWGRLHTLLLGQGMLAVALLCAIFVGGNGLGVIFALVFLGLGWSASTVSGAALLTEASAAELRPRRQGRNDSLMSLCAAIGAALSGAILSVVGYAGLAMVTMVIVAAVVCGAVWASRLKEPLAEPAP